MIFFLSYPLFTLIVDSSTISLFSDVLKGVGRNLNIIRELRGKTQSEVAKDKLNIIHVILR